MININTETKNQLKLYNPKTPKKMVGICKGNNLVCSQKQSTVINTKVFLSVLLIFLASLWAKEIKAQCPVIDSIKITTNKCGNHLAKAFATASSGVATYSYQTGIYVWSNTTGDLDVNAGTYTITVSDGGSCTSTSAFVMPANTGTIAAQASVINNVKCNGGNNGSASITASGGTAPYTASWSNASTGDTVSDLMAGTYTISITDALGCNKIIPAAITITEPAAITISSTNLVFPSCAGNDGSVKVSGTGGSNSYTFAYGLVGSTSLWMTGATGQSETFYSLKGGNWKVVAYDTKGCKDSTTVLLPDSCDLVWPGDANRDLVADNNDLLTIGTAYDSTGAARQAASISWTGQPALDWGQTLSNSKDYKNADCNGDGTIDANDTTAILLNYGLTHNLKIVKPPYIDGLPNLTFNIPSDTALSGSNIKVPVMLGSSTNPVNNISGIAFSINYDPKIVDTTKLSLSINGSWMGTNGSNIIYIAKNIGSMGRMDVAITRIDHKNISGFGKLAELNIYMRDDISGKLAGTLMKSLKLESSLLTAIDKDGTKMQINEGSDSIVVVQNGPMGIKDCNLNSTLKIYPNPTAGSFNIETTTNSILEIKLVNIMGETVWQQNGFTGNKLSVETEQLASGTYYLSITTANERIVKNVHVLK